MIPEQVRKQTVFEPSKTQQHFEPETNIRKIMARCRRTGTVPQRMDQPIFADVSEIPDLAEYQRMMISVNESFMSLPAKVRKEYDNNPIKFIEAAQNADEETVALFKKCGMIREPEPEPKNPNDELVERFTEVLDSVKKD